MNSAADAEAEEAAAAAAADMKSINAFATLRRQNHHSKQRTLGQYHSARWPSCPVHSFTEIHFLRRVL